MSLNFVALLKLFILSLEQAASGVFFPRISVNGPQFINALEDGRHEKYLSLYFTQQLIEIIKMR